MSKTTRYDSYTPIFTRTGDHRVAFMLDILVNNMKGAGDKTKVEPISLINAEILNENFENDSECNKVDAISPEWKTFVLELAFNMCNSNDLAGKDFSVGKNTDLYNALQKLFDNANTDKNSDAYYVAVIFSQLIDEGKVNNETMLNIMGNLAKSSTTTYKYKTKSAWEIVQVLFSNNVFAKSTNMNEFYNEVLSTEKKPEDTAKYVDIFGDANNNKVKCYPKWLRDAANLHKDAKINDNNIDIFGTATTGKDVGNCINLPIQAKLKTLNITRFNFNMDKYVRNRLFDAQEAKLPTNTASRFFDETVNDGKYWRKADGTLWTKMDGVDTQVDMSSKLFATYKYADMCPSNMVDVDKGETCQKYLMECLAGNNIEQCSAFMQKPDYWGIAKSEVDKMLPPVALKTLYAFNFKIVSVYDGTNKMNITKIITVPEWLLNLQKTYENIKNGSEIYKKIASNEKLLGYLRMLVNKVNTNPAILNKNVVKSDEQLPYSPNEFKGSILASYGMRPRIVASGVTTSSLNRLQEETKNNNNALSMRLGLPLSFNVPFIHPMLVGGNGFIDKLEENVMDENKQTWSVMQLHYMTLVDQLKKMNKDIAQADKEKIEGLIDSLRKSEVKLAQVLLMTAKYKELLQVHGEKDNENVLSVDHLKQFVDQRNKYFARVSKKQNDLISIIKAISEATSAESLAVDANTPVQSNMSLNGLL